MSSGPAAAPSGVPCGHRGLAVDHVTADDTDLVPAAEERTAGDERDLLHIEPISGRRSMAAE